MDVFPGQPQDFTHTQRAGKGKVHCYIEFAVCAFVQSKTDHIRRPDIPFRILRFREDHIVKGISCNDFPSYRLLKRTPQELDDLFNGLVADIGGNGLSGFGRHRLGFLQGLDITVNRTGSNRLYLHITDDRIDIVRNQRRLAVIHRHAPFLFSVKRYEVIKELGDRLIAWREESSRVLLIFDFCLALQGLFVGMPGFPLLFGFSVFVHIVVNNGIVFLSLDYRCHIVLPFLDHRSRESSHSSNDRLEMRMALPIRTILKCPSFTRIYAEVLPMPRI